MFFPSVTTAQVKVCIKTGIGYFSGGTDADVHLRLMGSNGCHSPWVHLDSPRDDFEQNTYDCFGYHTMSVGPEVSV